MNKEQWKVFCTFRNEFKEQVDIWKKAAPELPELQKAAVEKSEAPLYPFETSVVYNKTLDEVEEGDNIKVIVIGDNPGKDEQLTKNNKYLVGQAGKIAEGYFKRNKELNIDFRKDAIILNKTPVHSGKTAQLNIIEKLGGEKIKKLIEESQLWMAEKTAKLHIDLCNAGINNEADNGEKSFVPELWLVGYSELKGKGIFVKYRDCLKNYYFNHKDSSLGFNPWDKVFVFQHFSMNRFSIDLGNFIKNNNSQEEALPLIENIHKLGTLHKNEIFICF